MLEAEKNIPSENHLYPLPFVIREALQQIRPKSFVTLALLAGLNMESTLAATIKVNASCTLADAITTANTDTLIPRLEAVA